MTIIDGVTESGTVCLAEGKAVCSQALAEIAGVRHASTTRAFTNGLPAGATRLDEIRAACALIDAPGAFVAVGEQRHTANVAIVDAGQFQGERHHTFPQTDALVTDQVGVVLAIQTADCTPIFLVDPVARVIGLAHAGWRGTFERIAENTVAEMVSLGANAGNIVAWIGPMACVCCYEVSEELIEAFGQQFPDLSPARLHDGRHLNLLKVNIAQLQRAGLDAQNISESNICTIHQHEQFFSYRADNGTTGRIISALVLTED